MVRRIVASATVTPDETTPNQIKFGLAAEIDLSSAVATKTGASQSRTLADILADAVNIKDFGAVAGDNSAGVPAANVSAIVAAMTASPAVYIPPGDWYVEDIDVPTTVRHIFGEGTLIAAGSPTSGAGILNADSNVNGLQIEGITIEVDAGSFPNSRGINLDGCADVTVRSVAAQGSNGIRCLDCNGIDILDCAVPSYGSRGIVSQTSDNVKIIGNRVTGTTSVSHCISTEGGNNLTIHGNRCVGSGGFGISLSGDSAGNGPTDTPGVFVSCLGNIIHGTVLEGINLNGINDFVVSDNILFFDGNSTDFGLSLFGDVSAGVQVRYGVISNNLIYFPAKSGIALVEDVKFVHVTGNKIYTPNQGAGATADYTSGIILAGSDCVSNAVTGNFVHDNAGNMHYLVSEDNTIASGAPNNNTLAPNTASPSSKDAVLARGSTSEPGHTVEWIDDFFGDLLADEWTTLAGTDPQANAGVLTTAGVGGWLRMNMGDDAAASMAANGIQINGSLHWRADNGLLRFQMRFRPGVITTVALFFGFTDQRTALEMPFTLGGSDALTSNATDAVGVLFDTAADTDNWWLVGVANDVDATKQDTGVAPTANGIEEWTIEVSTTGAATFYRNGARIGSVMSGAVTPSVLLTPVVAGFRRAGTAGGFADVDLIKVRNRRGSF